MARPATGGEYLEEARQAMATAKTAAELRSAQAVLLRLELGLSLAATPDERSAAPLPPPVGCGVSFVPSPVKNAHPDAVSATCATART